MVRYVEGLGVDIHGTDNEGNPVLFMALQKSLSLVEYLIDNGADVNVYQKGMSAMHITIMGAKGGYKYMDKLIAAGLSADGPEQLWNEPGYASPLFLAASMPQRTEHATWLLDRGANVNFIIKEREISPLMVSAGSNNLDMVDLLLQRGANKDAKNANGMTAMDYATEGGFDDIAQYINDYDLNNKKNENTGSEHEEFSSEAEKKNSEL